MVVFSSIKICSCFPSGYLNFILVPDVSSNFLLTICILPSLVLFDNPIISLESRGDSFPVGLLNLMAYCICSSSVISSTRFSCFWTSPPMKSISRSWDSKKLENSSAHSPGSICWNKELFAVYCDILSPVLGSRIQAYGYWGTCEDAYGYI
eukprot:NODE_339_length_9219_cov_0.924232.p6 type:complete len:151 gc:universal NODE_339_length_9219_cov_0.924232:5325-5777(+)